MTGEEDTYEIVWGRKEKERERDWKGVGGFDIYNQHFIMDVYNLFLCTYMKERERQNLHMDTFR